MGRFKEIDSEIRSMDFDGFSATDIADFLNVDLSDVDDILDTDMQDLMGDANAAADLDADFYGYN